MTDEMMRWFDEVLGRPARPPSGYRVAGPLHDELSKTRNQMQFAHPGLVINPDVALPIPTWKRGDMEMLLNHSVKG